MLKTILTCAILMAFLSTLSAQIPSSCNRSSAFIQAYYNDVQKVAIENMRSSGTADSNSIAVLSSYSDPIFDALAAIGNTMNVLDEVDSIYNIYCIHHERWDAPTVPSQLMVSVDSNVAWTANWMNLSVPSGNATIDNLLAGHNYTVTRRFSFWPNVLMITFDSIVNVKPIKRQLELINGVNYAEEPPQIGDSNGITHNKVGNTSYVSFRLGWGDCSVGCIHSRVWSFSVDLTTCMVTYLGVVGSDPNDPTVSPNSPALRPGCNLLLSTPTPTPVPSVNIYPNPTIGLLTVEGSTEQLQLYNSLGSLVLERVEQATTTTLDLSGLPKGVYWLVINNNRTEKVVKQ